MFDLIHAKPPARTSRGSGSRHISMPIAILIMLIGSVANGQQMEAATSSRAENTSPEGDITPDVIAQAWRDRERRIRTFEFRWKVKNLIPAKSYSQWHNGSTIQLPEFDFETVDSFRLVVDGEKIRCEAFAAKFEQRIMGFAQHMKLTVDDGSQQWDVYAGDDSRPMEMYPGVFIDDSKTLHFGRAAHLQALLLCLRPFTIYHGGGCEFSRFSISPRMVVVNQRRCLALSSDRHGLWVDPERDFVVVRWRSIVGQEILRESTIDYTWHASGEWIPTSWENTNYESASRLNLGAQAIGPISSSAMARVTHADLNGRISANNFLAPTIPPGAYVTDRLKNERYILRYNGTKRIITEADLREGLSYEQLINGQPKPTPLTPSGRRSLVIAFTTAVLVGAMVAVLYRRKNARRV